MVFEVKRWLSLIVGSGASCWHKRCSVAAISVAIGACASSPVPGNQPVAVIDEDGGYRRLDSTRMTALEDSLVILSFSGGGSRAAALSYGVMQELRDTRIIEAGREVRALDVVDTISSVSGGSFTAAYYGAFRERLFEDYEQDFLRRGVQSALITKLLRPVNLVRGLAPGSDRTEMAVAYYDKAIFRGATFNDILEQGPPYIEINATELVNGLRFSFTQERFDLLCSDLGTFPLARAVTASSAVPGVFPTVVIENHANECDITGTQEWALMAKAMGSASGEAAGYMSRAIASYRDVDARPYIHLVDGGISDNLGLRALTDRFEHLSDYQFATLGHQLPSNIVIILVNAEVRRDRQIERSVNSPSLATTMATVTNVQMRTNNLATVDKLQQGIAEFRRRVAEADLQSEVYFTEVSFDIVQDEPVASYLNSLPTSLELDDEQVDRLIAVGRLLLRHDPSFRQFRQRNGGSLIDSAETSDAMCSLFGYQRCPAAMRED